MQLKILEDRVKYDRCCHTDAAPRLEDDDARGLASDFEIFAPRSGCAGSTST